MSKLRVWWIPQIPDENRFLVPVASVQEGVKVMNILADYDQYQLDNNIKPDYSNVGGLEMMESGEWTDWYDEETGSDDPNEYLEYLESEKSEL